MKNKNIVITYLALTLIFLFGVVLSFNNYSFSGYYMDKVINWLWLAMTVFIIIRFWKKKGAKIYFGILLSGTILSILPMMIPFFGMVLYFSTTGCDQHITLDDTYRMERGRPGVMSNPMITIYKKEGIFEKQISRTPYLDIIEQIQSSSHINEKELPVQGAKLININNDSIGIEYQIMNKKKVIYQKNRMNWFDDY
ncbi:hypothetical protein LF887_02705 [Chryseobacterium sp. MEBOG06]|uniref:hypothetical protein n=1 Tax=unclassified Chryseobacterium TaxID=2593645 RepID=UPI001F297289|nr:MULTISPECIES: hypothetical protein [unclassified Chryseobacterium]UKB84583.1 hypothetical protein LF887_02705 [Chryseobacterium sp. MEBOG06]